jgi:hypothetical protein
VQNAAGAEVQSGYFKADATGTQPETLGFEPDYIEFYAQQKTENLDFEDSSAFKDNCPENVNGWSEGAALFESGTVQKQFSIAAARNSDSTNDHRVASSTSHVIKMPYAGRNGATCGNLRVSVTSVSSNGFSYDIESRYQFDEIVRYKAYNFPDNMEFDAGMVKIESEGELNVSTGFRPANLHIRAAQQITSKNTDRQFGDNEPDKDNTLGRSKGYATLDRDGNVVNQQSIGTASSSHSTDAHRSLASDDFILNTAYVGQDANQDSSGNIQPPYGRLKAKVTGSSSNNFSMNVTQKWDGYQDQNGLSSNGNEVFLYRAWGFSFYDFQIGYGVVEQEGEKQYTTGFEPDAIDLYSEQQIKNIDKELTTPLNSGCDNSAGWSYGYYDNENSKQWSLSTGRSSDSQDAHRYGASSTDAINNVYSGQSGQDCGSFEGKVSSTSGSGFSMDFSFDSEFSNNYGKELFYYRALDFQTTSPTINNLSFKNTSQGHEFSVNATIKEGSNDITSCEIDATAAGVTEEYTGQVRKIDDSWRRCTYRHVKYDDNSDWELEHDDNQRLLSPSVQVNITDTAGNFDVLQGSNTFPNHIPDVRSFDYSDIRPRYAFNTSVKVDDTDNGDIELSSCELTFTSGGSSFSVNTGLEEIPGKDLYTCNYSDVNNTYKPGFEVLKDVEIEAEVQDIHSGTRTETDTYPIPNTKPSLTGFSPENESSVPRSPVTISASGQDPEGDEVAMYFVNATGQTGEVLSKVPAGSSFGGSYDWGGLRIREPNYWYVNLSDPYSNYTSYLFSFEKVTVSDFRVEVSIPTRYRGFSMSPRTKKSIMFSVSNPSSRTKNLNMSLEGINASLENGKSYEGVVIPPGEEKEFNAVVEPLSAGSKTLGLSATSTDTLLENRRNIPIVVKQMSAVEEREVPGLTAIQILLAFAGALAFFWFS